MKHLNPTLERLEARIAPCLPPLICIGLCGGGGGGGGGADSGSSCSNGSGSSASGSKSSHSKSRESCSS